MEVGSSINSLPTGALGILYVGIDLAKNVFAVHGVNEVGKSELVHPSAARARLHDLVVAQQP